MSHDDMCGSEAPRPRLGERVERSEFDAALQSEGTEQALREGPRQFFALIAEVARGEFDPSERWDEFVQALWEQVAPASV